MTWLMEILKVYLEEQLLIKYCVVKHLILLKNPKYDGYQRGIASMVYKCLDKKTSATRANKYAGSSIKNENI